MGGCNLCACTEYEADLEDAIGSDWFVYISYIT